MSLDRVQVALDASQAEAALAVMAGGDPAPLLDCPAYRRFKQREQRMGSLVSDEEFIAWLRAPQQAARFAGLRATLDAWLQVDVDGAARKALAYLPADAGMRARLYVMIKPKTNSFVWELDSDPAIFLSLNPEISLARLENTLAHELHHVGAAAGERALLESAEWQALPADTRAALEWVGAFGEGLAMLAAAGDADTHPHACSTPEERAEWDANVANFDADLRRVEAFLWDVLHGRLQGEAAWQAVFDFFGKQGPWYTLGWQMASVVERVLGRGTLVACFSDPRLMLGAYNEAARVYNVTAPRPLALWDEALVSALEG